MKCCDIGTPVNILLLFPLLMSKNQNNTDI